MKNIKGNFLIAIGTVLIAIGSLSIGREIGDKRGYERGYLDGGISGVNEALDTVSTLLDRQLYSDSLVSKLVIRDTAVYYLSPKSIIKE